MTPVKLVKKFLPLPFFLLTASGALGQLFTYNAGFVFNGRGGAAGTLTADIDPINGTTSVGSAFTVPSFTVSHTVVGANNRNITTVIPATSAIPANFPFPAVPAIPERTVITVQQEVLSISYLFQSATFALQSPQQTPTLVGGNLFSVPLVRTPITPWAVQVSYQFTDSFGASSVGSGSYLLDNAAGTLFVDVTGYPGSIATWGTLNFQAGFAGPLDDFVSELGNHFVVPTLGTSLGISSVPEPESYAVLFGTAVAGLAMIRTVRRCQLAPARKTEI